MYMAEVRNFRPYIAGMVRFSLLIVDDDEALLEAIQDTIRLRLPHVSVSTSPSAQEALRLLSLQSYDVTLSDVRMPSMDGYRLLSQIRNLWPTMPVLLMSGHLDAMPEGDPKQAGAFAVLNKPLDRDVLISHLQRALEKTRLIPGEQGRNP
jgi:two-component system, NtrC family, response regulator GlrR